MFTFLIETFILGLKNLRLHKLRSLLTALGIIIGVFAVILGIFGRGTGIATGVFINSESRGIAEGEFYDFGG